MEEKWNKRIESSEADGWLEIHLRFTLNEIANNLIYLAVFCGELSDLDEEAEIDE